MRALTQSFWTIGVTLAVVFALLTLVSSAQARQPRTNAPVLVDGHWVFADQKLAPRAVTLLAADAIRWWQALGYSPCEHPVLWTAPSLWKPGDPLDENGSPLSVVIYARSELNGCQLWLARWMTYYLESRNYEGLRTVCRSVYHEVGHTAGVEHLEPPGGGPEVVVYHGRQLGGEVAGLMSGQTNVVACNRWARARAEGVA